MTLLRVLMERLKPSLLPKMKLTFSPRSNPASRSFPRSISRYTKASRMLLFSRMNSLKIILERHPDGFVSYPLGLKGVVVGQGDTYEAALADVRSAINFHIETFGPEAFESDSPVLDAFIAETQLAA